MGDIGSSMEDGELYVHIAWFCYTNSAKASMQESLLLFRSPVQLRSCETSTMMIYWLLLTSMLQHVGWAFYLKCDKFADKFRVRI